LQTLVNLSGRCCLGKSSRIWNFVRVYPSPISEKHPAIQIKFEEPAEPFSVFGGLENDRVLSF
jgi:hypothetical protein